MKTIRPALSTEQIATLKTDIKLLSKILKGLANSKTFPVVSTQNSVAKRMHFTSFSELTLHAKRPHNDLVPYSLVEDVSVDDLDAIYGDSFRRYFPSVIIEMKNQKSPKQDDNNIGVAIFKRAYDKNEINGGLLNLETGLPSHGKVNAEYPEFKDLFEGDVFKVLFNDLFTTFTVMERSSMMDTGLKVLIIKEGRWVESLNGALRIS